MLLKQHDSVPSGAGAAGKICVAQVIEEIMMKFDEVILQRHSVRKFTQKCVDCAVIRKILDGGMCAPVSMKRYSNIKFTVIKSDEKKRALNQLFMTPSPFYNANVLILISAKEEDVAHITDFNVACIVENMMLAATNYGVGSIFLTKFLLEIQDELRELFDIDDDYTTFAAVGLGYEENQNPEVEKMSARRDRIPVQFF